MDHVEIDFTDLQLQIATQNNKNKKGKHHKIQEIVGTMMSNRIDKQYINYNYSQCSNCAVAPFTFCAAPSTFLASTALLTANRRRQTAQLG